MWNISKTFNFCYGHRVWAQEINTDFTEKGHTCPKCRHLHGHEGKVLVHLSSEKLDNRGMVEDFVNLGWVKDFLDDYVDHKFIIDINDPWFDNIINGSFDKENMTLHHAPSFTTIPVVPLIVSDTEYVVGWYLDVDKKPDMKAPKKEFYEGFLMVDFIPTSEKLSEWLYNIIQAKMSLIDVNVSQIDWWETPKSRATYIPPNK